MSFKPVTVTSVIEPFVSYNPRRRGFSIFNNGSDTFFVSADPSNVAADGFPVAAGVTLTMLEEDDDEPWMAHYAVSSAGDINARVQESIKREVPVETIQ